MLKQTVKEDIVQKALRLKELDKLIIKAIANLEVEQLPKYIGEFGDLKKQIRSYGLEHPVVFLQDLDNLEIRSIIQKIISGEPFQVEKALSNSPIEEFLKGELDEIEIDDLGSELFYSWYSHSEYIRGLYEIGALTISCGKIPDNLSRFVREARNCYAFQQFNAVFSLCRTTLEVCIKDLATTYKIIPSDSDNIKQMMTRSPELYELIEQLCGSYRVFKGIRNQLHKIRRETNFIIHGNRIVKKQEAKDMLQNTLLVIHKLYEIETSEHQKVK